MIKIFSHNSYYFSINAEGFKRSKLTSNDNRAEIGIMCEMRRKGTKTRGLTTLMRHFLPMLVMP